MTNQGETSQHLNSYIKGNEIQSTPCIGHLLLFVFWELSLSQSVLLPHLLGRTQVWPPSIQPLATVTELGYLSPVTDTQFRDYITQLLRKRSY